MLEVEYNQGMGCFFNAFIFTTHEELRSDRRARGGRGGRKEMHSWEANQLMKMSKANELSDIENVTKRREQTSNRLHLERKKCDEILYFIKITRLSNKPLNK